MLKQIRILFYLLGVSFLFSSCAAPLMLGGLGYYTLQEKSMQPTEEYSFDKIEEIAISSGDLYLEPMNVDEYGENVAYVGEPNRITIYLSDNIDAKNLVWDLSMGKIEKGSEENTYNFYIDKTELDIEITVLDTVTGLSDYIVCYSAYMPLPTAFLQEGETSTMKASIFKEQKMLNLDISSINSTILCDCKSFRITRMSKGGKREELVNRSNGFSDQAKALVGKADAGDIYVFDQINVTCPGYTEAKVIKSIVYSIE